MPEGLPPQRAGTREHSNRDDLRPRLCAAGESCWPRARYTLSFDSLPVDRPSASDGGGITWWTLADPIFCRRFGAGMGGLRSTTPRYRGEFRLAVIGDGIATIDQFKQP
jgi:hypothetical protein